MFARRLGVAPPEPYDYVVRIDVNAPRTLADLRAFAVRRSLRLYPTLADGIAGLGFVQADPIRAPARAQDLILRQRVEGYRAGDLEAAYPELAVDEEMFHVHGFLARPYASFLHPRKLGDHWRGFLEEHRTLRPKVLAFVRKHGEAHPRALDRALGGSASQNAWGGSSSSTTMMLEALHRVGVLRVARRDGGLRVYALAPPRPKALPKARGEGIARILAKLYAPLPERWLYQLFGRFRTVDEASPSRGLRRLHLDGELSVGLAEGQAWFWPADEALDGPEDPRARLLSPFDPIVWDRRRFELFWGWEYRFEAYTPEKKRKLGYYALPILWRGHVVGWANVTTTGGTLDASFGYVARPKERAFRAALDEEIDRLRWFLRLPGGAASPV